MKKKFLAMLTALLCVSTAMSSVSAYAMPGDLADCTELLDTVDYELSYIRNNRSTYANVERLDSVYRWANQEEPEDNMLVWENPQESGLIPVIVTDGTVPTIDGSRNILPLYQPDNGNCWYCEESKALKNAYTVDFGQQITEADLLELAEKYECIESIYWAEQKTYKVLQPSGIFRLVLPADMTASYETLPELAVFGEDGYFVKVAGNQEQTVWDFDGSSNTCEITQGEEENLKYFRTWAYYHPEESYYFIKELENEIDKNHSDVEISAEFYSHYIQAPHRIVSLIPVTARSSSSVKTVQTQSVLSGDVDDNSQADILDVITINKAVLGKEVLTDEQNEAADLNKNGKVDSDDALLLMKSIIGLI